MKLNTSKKKNEVIVITKSSHFTFKSPKVILVLFFFNANKFIFKQCFKSSIRSYLNFSEN